MATNTEKIVVQVVVKGQKELQKQIEEGWSASEIRKSWQKDLEKFKKIRANYLLYP
mgnify:CR=1 FL=1